MEARTNKQAQTIDRLSAELDSLVSDPQSEIAKENSKLKYQITQLQKAIAEERANLKPLEVEMSASILDSLVSLFTVAIAGAFPNVPFVKAAVNPTSPKQEKFGDYQCNSSMQIAGMLKDAGEKIAPRDVAKKIVENIPSNDLIKETTIAGPGFINVFICQKYMINRIGELNNVGVKYDTSKSAGRKVVVDYSSPNIAKEMHVGHLRSTIIGDSIANLFETYGYEVLRINHVGDWGTQFGMLIAHLIDLFPDYDKNVPRISDLQKFYKESKKRFDDEEDFKKRAYENVVKLQSHDPAIHKAWQAICEVSRIEFQKVYDRLQIKGLKEVGESFYQDKMNAVVDQLKKRDMLEFDDGRYIMWAPGIEIPLTVVKTGGGYTYDTSDLTALNYRANEIKGDILIYVVDCGQELHFRQVFAAASKAGFYDAAKTRVEHAGFGVVLGEDKKKFKTRSGETVRLVDLLDEGIKRANEQLLERGREKELTAQEMKDAADAVAYGCIKYADLKSNRKNDYVFSFDQMLDIRGNTAAYLLYQLTRIRSVNRKVEGKITDEEISKIAASGKFDLADPREFKLAKTILRFHEILSQAQRDLLLHPICEWMYELSNAFSQFYDKCYIIEKKDGKEEIKVGRLILATATASVMEAAFKILGIRTLHKM